MKENIKIVILVLAISFGLPLAFIFVDDVVRFHKNISNTTYGTPWYHDSWVKGPYTKFCLSWHPATYHITTNAVGDLWVVKEVKVGETTFWTIKYKIDKETIKKK